MNAVGKTTRAATEALPGRKSLWLLVHAAWLLICGGIPAPGATAPENDVKAAFLYNFTKFVVWPEEAFPSTNAPIRFAVLGDEEFGSRLKLLLNDKKAHGRSFEVETISNGQEARNFHIVFVP